MVWSKEPPRIEMSACTPLPPRSRKSIAGTGRSAASRVWKGAAAALLRSKSGVCVIALRVGLARLPVTPTSSICMMRSTVSESEVCVCATSVAGKRIDIETERTPSVTGRCMLAKTDQPLRFHRRKQKVRFVLISFILFWFGNLRSRPAPALPPPPHPTRSRLCGRHPADTGAATR